MSELLPLNQKMSTSKRFLFLSLGLVIINKSALCVSEPNLSSPAPPL